MFSWFRKSDKNTSEIKVLLQELNLSLDSRLSEIKAEIKENRLAIQDLETKLLTKDLKDKQMYGQLHYKLHEVKPSDKN